MSVEQAGTSNILDIQGALSRLGGDKELFSDMAAISLEDAPRLETELRNAVAARDASAIRMKAHALKGLIAGCGGMRSVAAAQKLEDAGKDAKMDRLESQLAELEAELRQFYDALRPYVRTAISS